MPRSRPQSALDAIARVLPEQPTTVREITACTEIYSEAYVRELLSTLVAEGRAQRLIEPNSTTSTRCRYWRAA
jgi:hypothetical protein